MSKLRLASDRFGDPHSADLRPTVVPAFSGSLRSRFGKAAMWNAIGAAFTQGATFFTNILVANLLGRELFGQYSIILSTLMTIAGVAQLATGLTATRYVAELRNNDKARAGRILGMCSIVALVAGAVGTATMGMSATWLAADVLSVPQAALGLQIAAAFVLFSVMNGYQSGALAGLEAYRTLARLGALTGIAQVAASVGLTWLWGLNGALLGLVLTSVLRWWVYSRGIKREAAAFGIQVTRHGLRQEKPVFFRFALPAAISGISSLPALWLANALLVRQPNGLTEMALFMAANNLRILALFLPNLLSGVGTMLINNQLGAGDRKKYSEAFWINVVLTSITVICGALLVAVLGPTLLNLYGREFGPGYQTLLVLLVATVLEGVALGPYQIVQSHERMWLSLLVIALPRDISLVLLAYFLAPQMGSVGLAYAYTVASLLAVILTTTNAYRIVSRAARAEASLRGII